MSAVELHNTGNDYRNGVTISFTHGSMRLIVDQQSPVQPNGAERTSMRLDEVVHALVCDAYRVGFSISDYVIDNRVAVGSSFTEGAAWQKLGSLQVRARVTVSVTRAVPEYVLSEAVDKVLQNFRNHLRLSLDPSYKAYLAEKEAREEMVAMLSGMNPAAFLAAVFSGGDVMLGQDGLAGAMVGRPFGPFAGGNGFAG